MEKFTVSIGNKIRRLNVEGWTDKEVTEACDVPQNRLTEIKNFKKYGRAINETFLAAFIDGGIITIDELINGHTLSSEEKEYASGLKSDFYKDRTKLETTKEEMGK